MMIKFLLFRNININIFRLYYVFLCNLNSLLIMLSFMNQKLHKYLISFLQGKLLTNLFRNLRLASLWTLMSICLSFGWPIMISLKSREITPPCFYRSTCCWLTVRKRSFFIVWNFFEMLPMIEVCRHEMLIKNGKQGWVRII